MIGCRLGRDPDRYGGEEKMYLHIKKKIQNTLFAMDPQVILKACIVCVCVKN